MPTLGELWRIVHLHASAVPPGLCREWIFDAYRSTAQDRRWGWLRVESRLQVLAARSLAVDVTLGSPTVVGTFLATDASRQFRVGNSGTPYTIGSVAGGLGSLTLDIPYGEASGTVTATIFNGYHVMPDDYMGLRSITNPQTLQPIFWAGYTDELIDFYDPTRIFSDSTPRVLATKRPFATGHPLAGRIVMEWWPYPTAAGTYPVSYFAKPGTVNDATSLQGVLADRSDILVTKALADAARYPGTPERRNPYFNLALAAQLEIKAREDTQTIAVLDNDQYQQDLETVDLRGFTGYLPRDTHVLRQTDATLADYFGGSIV